MDRRLRSYRVLLAPVLARLDGATEDPGDLKVAEAILVAAESGEGAGLTRAQIATRAGLHPTEERFERRFDLLVAAGALHRLRGDKPQQTRYVPDPDALLAAELLARLGERGGAEELHSLLVAAADTVELAFADKPERPPPSVEEVAGLVGKLAAVLHAYATRMQVAVASGTFAELVAARTGQATTRHLQYIVRITGAINQEHSPYQGLFHDANWLLDAGQRFVAAAEQLADRLVEVAVAGHGGGLLGLLTVRQCVDAAIGRAQAQLAEVAAGVAFDLPAPLVHLADLQAAAASLTVAPRRLLPRPPDAASEDAVLAALAARQRAAHARAASRQGWADRLLADAEEVDVTEHAAGWPHAAKLLSDLLALSRDPAVPLAADIGEPPLVEPDAEVVVRHPLRLRRLQPRHALPSAAKPGHPVVDGGGA